jgi:DNA polymerase-3 subunit gamma/tau
VDVPDVSDDVDPWTTPLPTPQTDDQEQGQPNGPEQPRQNQPEQHSERHSARQSAREMQSQQAQQPASSPAGFADDPWGAPMPVQAGPPEPEVAPEDDEYSMSDESIGASNALDMNDLNRVFEVKKVEEFSSDDPHNPRNMQVKKTLDD